MDSLLDMISEIEDHLEGIDNVSFVMHAIVDAIVYFDVYTREEREPLCFMVKLEEFAASGADRLKLMMEAMYITGGYNK